jgi:hypothetical protein
VSSVRRPSSGKEDAKGAGTKFRRQRSSKWMMGADGQEKQKKARRVGGLPVFEHHTAKKETN